MSRTVLLVEDDVLLSRALNRALQADGFQVIHVNDVDSAKRVLNSTSFDLVVCDVKLPDQGSGISVIRHVRERDDRTPLILMSAHPDFEAAVLAIDLGVQRFLKKPFTPEEFRRTVNWAVNTRPRNIQAIEAPPVAPAPPVAVPSLTGDQGLGGLSESLDRAMESLWLATQPIVDWRNQRVFARECLLRTQEPTLMRPDDMIRVALALGRLPELAGRVRAAAVRILRAMDPSEQLFVNLHPHELRDETLYDDRNPLRPYSARVVFEITEQVSINEMSEMPERVKRLRLGGFRVALDDLGSGYAGLTALTKIEPDIVKLDMGLVRNCDTNVTQQRVIRSITTLCRDLKLLVIAEGVETTAERDEVLAAGVELFQGFLFARPSKGFPAPAWNPPAQPRM